MNASKARLEVIEALRECVAELKAAIERRRGVIAAHNSVVRTSPGLYLVPRGDVFGVGGITSGVVMWGPEDARIQAEHSRKFPGGERAEAVFYVDALRDELKATEDLLAGIEERAAVAA